MCYEVTAKLIDFPVVSLPNALCLLEEKQTSLTYVDLIEKAILEAMFSVSEDKCRSVVGCTHFCDLK